MSTQTRTLLFLSLTGFALVPTGVAWGLGLPLGFICFGLFMISKIMQKEVARYDVEQQSRKASIERKEASTENHSAADELHDHSFSGAAAR